VASLGRLFAQRLDETSGARQALEAAYAQLRADDPRRAATLAHKGLALVRSRAVRQQLWTALAWAAIAERDALAARDALLRLPGNALDSYLVAAYLSACNRTPEAAVLLLQARALGQRDRESTRLLLDLLLREGAETNAADIARADRGLLSDEDWRALATALPALGAGDHHA